MASNRDLFNSCWGLGHHMKITLPPCYLILIFLHEVTEVTFYVLWTFPVSLLHVTSAAIPTQRYRAGNKRGLWGQTSWQPTKHSWQKFHGFRIPPALQPTLLSEHPIIFYDVKVKLGDVGWDLFSERISGDFFYHFWNGYFIRVCVFVAIVLQTLSTAAQPKPSTRAQSTHWSQEQFQPQNRSCERAFVLQIEHMVSRHEWVTQQSVTGFSCWLMGALQV